MAEMSNEQVAAWIQSMGDLSSEEMALQAQLDRAKSLREPPNQRMDWASQAARGLQGVGAGMAEGQYAKSLKDYGVNKKKSIGGIADLLLNKKAVPSPMATGVAPILRDDDPLNP